MTARDYTADAVETLTGKTLRHAARRVASTVIAGVTTGRGMPRILKEDSNGG